VVRLQPQALGSLFVASYDSQGYGGGTRPCLHTGIALNWSKVEVKVTLRLTVSQSVFLLGLMTRYLLLFDSYGVVFVGHPI
jgi:hypothetical protein